MFLFVLHQNKVFLSSYPTIMDSDDLFRAGVDPGELLDMVIRNEEEAAKIATGTPLGKKRTPGTPSSRSATSLTNRQMPENVSSALAFIKEMKEWKKNTTAKDKLASEKIKKAHMTVCEWMRAQADDAVLEYEGYTLQPFVSAPKARYSDKLLLDAYKDMRKDGLDHQLLRGASAFFTYIEKRRRAEGNPTIKLSVHTPKSATTPQTQPTKSPSTTPTGSRSATHVGTTKTASGGVRFSNPATQGR